MSQLPNNSLPFTDDVIRAFLLGRLDAADQKQFEEKLITDDELETRLRLAEFQLADDFVLGRIDRVDSRRLDKTFLLTDERKRLLKTSTALRDRLLSSTTSELRTPWRFRQFFSFDRPAWRFAFTVALALILIAAFYLVTKEPQIVKRILTRRAPSKPAAVSTPLEVHHPKDTAPPAHQDTVTPPPAHESTLPPAADSKIVATVALASGVSSDIAQAPSIGLPADIDGIVRLQLAVEHGDSEQFTAELFTDLNQSAFVADSVRKTGSGGLDFDVPVRVLKAGDYRVQLSRLDDGSKKIVASYYFRVR